MYRQPPKASHGQRSHIKDHDLSRRLQLRHPTQRVSQEMTIWQHNLQVHDVRNGIPRLSSIRPNPCTVPPCRKGVVVRSFSKHSIRITKVLRHFRGDNLVSSPARRSYESKYFRRWTNADVNVSHWAHNAAEQYITTSLNTFLRYPQSRSDRGQAIYGETIVALYSSGCASPTRGEKEA